MFNKTTLEELIKVVDREMNSRNHIQFTIPEGFQKYNDEGAPHEAAFDAMLTGQIFACVAKILDLKIGGGGEKLARIRNIENELKAFENLVLQNIFSQKCYYFGKDIKVEKTNSSKVNF